MDQKSDCEVKLEIALLILETLSLTAEDKLDRDVAAEAVKNINNEPREVLVDSLNLIKRTLAAYKIAVAARGL